MANATFAGPPVPVLTDSDPGIQLLFSGDPDTTESSTQDSSDPNAPLLPDCAFDAPRAGMGGEGGKSHNDFLFCDNWDFGARDWGQAGFLQGAFVLGASPFSDDGGWGCSGNGLQGGGGLGGPCVNSTIRVVSTFKNLPPPGEGSSGGQAMSETKDWVTSFDFKVDIPAGDTLGNDKLFQLNANVDLLRIEGANERGGSVLDGSSHRYVLVHGTGVTNQEVRTLIEPPLSEGKITVHYKFEPRTMDVWLDDTLIAGDGLGIVGPNYLARLIQLGGGDTSFENALYDNILMGVTAVGCGPDGPGTSGIPGDFNCDGVVDVADLGIVGANFNASEVTYADGDANLDGNVDVADLGIVGANWSAAQVLTLQQAVNSAGLSALIPEPASIAVMVFGLTGMGYLRRRGSICAFSRG